MNHWSRCELSDFQLLNATTCDAQCGDEDVNYDGGCESCGDDDSDAFSYLLIHKIIFFAMDYPLALTRNHWILSCDTHHDFLKKCCDVYVCPFSSWTTL